MRPTALAAAIALLLVAWALRLFHLDFRALWWDEGLSLFFARLSYLEQARFAVLLADTNPPVYRLLLGAWTLLAGSSAWAARAFSALAGIVTVAGVYRLAADITMQKAEGGGQTELAAIPSTLHATPAPFLAAALAAASPMLIYYAQEAKGYSLVAAAALLSVVIWRRLHAGPTGHAFGWRWVAWGACVLLALGSHYIFAFLLAIMNLWSLWRARALPRRAARAHLARLAGAQLVVAAFLLPFVLATFAQTSAAVRGETGEFTGLGGPAKFFTQHIVEFALGPAGALGPGLALALLLALAGALGAVRAGRPGLVTGSMIVGPLLLGFALNSYHEFFFPRFLLYTVPLLLMLAALGLNALRGWGSWVSAALLVAAFVPTLRDHYATPGDPSEDWRPLAAAIQPLMRPADGALYVWGWMPGYLHAYLPPAPEPEYRLGYFTPDNLADDLSATTAQHDRIWLFDYQIDAFDVRNSAGRWLGERAALAYAQWFGNAHVSLFVRPDAHECSEQTAMFENGLTVGYCTSELRAGPGDVVGVELAWQAAAAPQERLTVYMHVLSPDGAWIAGRDSEPHNGLLPFSEWQGQAAMQDWHATVLPVDLPAGEYDVRVGLYDAITGARVLLADGSDGINVARLRAQPPSAVQHWTVRLPAESAPSPGGWTGGRRDGVN